MSKLTFCLSWLRVCANCGYGLWLRTKLIDLYCETCWGRFEDVRNRSFSLLQESSGALQRVWIYSLLTWTPETAHIVKPLMYQLKRGGLPEAYERLAEMMSFEMALAQDLSRAKGRLVFVIPPSRRSSQRDHAYLWAQAFARIWQGEVWTGLELPEPERGHQSFWRKTKQTTQKMKTREERLKKTYVLGRPLPVGKSVVFVDDVLTSGATAEAAWRALKEPHDFQVWVIAYRPKLAGFSSLC